MSKIRILPEQLANRIAAGEVVERPASVVKELLENSLDAGAGKIEVEIEGGGTRLIRVIDNGEGMDEDDLLLCLERHGTSKISSGEDLDAIHSLGFRGEAIPSIGSVSRMSITSRPAQATLGTKVVQDYGKLMKVHETGCHRGTTFEIRNLFGNTPARRKFLRTNRTELAHIEEVIKNYALAAPTTTFILRIDEREVLNFDATLPLADRLRAILHYRGPLLELGQPEDLKSLGTPSAPLVQGWLVPPDAVVAGSAGLRLLINGRTVRDRQITHAVAEGLRNFLMKGRNPAGLLHLRLPPEDVDVNVHPTKQEIRLRDSQAIHHLIARQVADAMQRHQKTLQANFFHRPAAPAAQPKEMQPPLTVRREAAITRRASVSFQPVLPPISATAQTAKAPQVATPLHPEPDDISRRPPVSATVYQPVPTLQPAAQTSEPERPPVSPPKDSAPHQTSLTAANPEGHGLQIIGQYDNLYIFCRAADGGLLVIDQHAAHERLLFEELKNQFRQGHVVSQALLFPATVELSAGELEQAERHLDSIRQMGFTIREFGGNTFVISAIPAMAGHSNPAELFRDILQHFSNGAGPRGESSSILDDILASMACKAAVKAGNQLHHREIEALLNRMARADLFSHCPHGRPVLKHFSASEVKKWFYRP